MSDYKPDETQRNGGPPLLRDEEVFNLSMAILLKIMSTVST